MVPNIIEWNYAFVQSDCWSIQLGQSGNPQRILITLAYIITLKLCLEIGSKESP